MGDRGVLSFDESLAPSKMWILKGEGVVGDNRAADPPTTLWVYKV